MLAEAAAAAAEDGVHLEDVGERRARSKWGAAAEGKEMQDLGVETVKGIVNNVEALWERYPQVRRVRPDEWTSLSADVMKQVREEGFEIDTSAVWGRRRSL